MQVFRLSAMLAEPVLWRHGLRRKRSRTIRRVVWTRCGAGKPPGRPGTQRNRSIFQLKHWDCSACCFCSSASFAGQSSVPIRSKGYWPAESLRFLR